MNYKRVELNDIVVYRFEGEFTVFTLDKFEEDLQRELSNGKYKFVFNFEKVDQIDSYGISLLIVAGKQAVTHGYKLAVSGANKRVALTIEVSEIDAVVKMFDTEEEAIAFLSS